jgi:hypothetical protein
MLLKGEGHEFGLPFRLQTPEPDEHDSRVVQALAKYQLVEILICGQEHRIQLATHQKNRIVVDTRIEFRDRQDFMSIRTEPVNNLLIDVFVRADLHSPAFSLG